MTLMLKKTNFNGKLKTIMSSALTLLTTLLVTQGAFAQVTNPDSAAPKSAETVKSTEVKSTNTKKTLVLAKANAELAPAVKFDEKPSALAQLSDNEAKAVLKLALEKLGQFQAKFSQTVLDANGKLLQQSNGQFAITRPGKFHWQVIAPEDELIISNGAILWYYSPFLEQVTLMNVQSALRDTPFLLMAQQDSLSWQQYDVSMIKQEQGLRFALQNKAQRDATFYIQLDDKQQLQSFSVKEKGGSHSEFMISDLKAQSFPDDKFSFKIPAGTEIDDQR